MLYQSEYHSPLGRLIIVCDDKAVKGVWFSDQKYVGASYDLDSISVQLSTINQHVHAFLESYFKKENTDMTIPCDPEVTPFRRRVLKVLQTIPYGKTMSYKAIATILNKDTRYPKTSARAVGGAVGHNPISLLIPCHRVIGSQGQLTGYAGGINRKKQLLALEC